MRNLLGATLQETRDDPRVSAAGHAGWLKTEPPPHLGFVAMTHDPFFGIGDPFSSLSHFVGALAGVALARPLVRRATQPTARLSLWAFVVSAVCLLAASGAYHFLPRGSWDRDLAQRFDHAGIFMLIAGTFSAGHGLFFKGFWRGGMITVAWVLATAGILLKLAFFESISEGTGLTIYMVMGWFGLVLMIKLHLSGHRRAALQLFAGNVVYTIGALGDHFGGEGLELLPGVIGPHELFHVAVLGGLGIHWWLFHATAAQRARVPEHPLVDRGLPAAGRVLA